MRRFLVSAAMAPLCAVCTPALAETLISNERTTPIQTSTANNGAADDVRIAAGGSVRPTAGAAVTLDSDDNVTNEGTIEIKNSDGAVGILVQGGRTGVVLNKGVISVVEDFTGTDTDNDGDVDGVFAQGKNRYGIRITGATPFVGSVTNDIAGRIQVEGVDSFGVSVEAGVTGDLNLVGATSVLGDRARGVSITGPVSGNVIIGSVTTTGQGAIGVDVAGAVGGRLTFNNAVATTGYRNVNRPADVTKLDADDLLQGGPAVRISADVAGGIVVDIPPTDSSTTDTDEDDDGVPDASEVSASIRSFGSAPAMLIAATGRDITIGGVSADEASLFIRGNVGASGVYDGVAATGIQIGDVGSGQVRLTNGLRLTGALEALAVKADATALRLTTGAVVPTITVSGGAAAATAGGVGTARTVLIEQGASAATLRNTGVLQSTVVGAATDAIVIEDRSGSLSLVETSGTLLARRVPIAGDTTAITGRTIAIDLSANTAGATVRQTGRTDGDDGGDNVADPDADGDGVDDADESSIRGDIRLGSGADAVELLNGTMNGDIAFGAGADRLLIDGTARYRGAVTDSDGALGIDVRRGTLELTNSQPLNLTTLDVAANGALVLTVNPQNAGAAALQVAGAAQFATGAQLGVRLTSLITGPQQFTLIQAGSLTAPGLQNQALADTPFLFVSALTVDETADRITLDVRRRTADEAGLNRAAAGAFDAVYQALGQDAGLRDAFLAQTTGAGFRNLYGQMLPEHSGGALYSLAAGAQAMSSALVEKMHTDTPAGARGGWVQEVGFRVEREPGDDAGFNAGGFGFMGGLDMGALGGVVGVSASFLTSEIEDVHPTIGESFSVSSLEAGVYWRGDFGRLTTSARGAVGYASLSSDRRLATDGLSRAAEADWNGLTATGHAGAGYEVPLGGRFYARPEARLDAFLLREGAHDETGGGAGFDLSVEERSSHLVSGMTLINLGAQFGRTVRISSELSVGWRQILSGGVGDTTARFGSGDLFTITPADAPSGAAVVGLTLSGGSAWSHVSLQARAETGDDYLAADIRLNIRFLF